MEEGIMGGKEKDVERGMREGRERKRRLEWMEDGCEWMKQKKK